MGAWIGSALPCCARASGASGSLGATAASTRAMQSDWHRWRSSAWLCAIADGVAATLPDLFEPLGQRPAARERRLQRTGMSARSSILEAGAGAGDVAAFVHVQQVERAGA